MKNAIEPTVARARLRRPAYFVSSSRRTESVDVSDLADEVAACTIPQPGIVRTL
jgi:hypothetical protein